MNPNQQQAAKSGHAWNVVFAGPGSGKTHVQIERAKHIQHRGKFGLHNCAFVTFTANGAEVFRQRLRKELPNDKPGFVGTLHSMMLGFLRKDELRWTLVGESDAEDFIQRFVKDLGYRSSAEDLVAARREPAPPIGAVVTPAQRVIRMYRQFMRSEALLDYDMVLTEGLKLLTIRPSINPWPCWFVDEFQDSSAIDASIYLAANPSQLFVTADPDQAIFGFRGARVKNATDFWHDDRFATHVLDLNYRCSPQVCELANDVIRWNKDRVPKETVSAGNYEGRVECAEYASDHDERAAIAKLIDWWMKSGTDARKIAVLCRTNDVANNVRDHLRSQKIPVTETESPKKPKDWRLLTLLVTMVAGPTSWANARMLAREMAKQTGKSVDETEQNVEAYRKNCPGAQAASYWTLPTAKHILSMNADFSRLGVSKGTHKLLADRIRLYNPDNLDELLEAMRESPESILKHGVHVKTVHGAKGEEYLSVIIAGADQFHSASRVGMEEERRLFFVAITRAMRDLFVTAARTRSINAGGVRRQIECHSGELFQAVVASTTSPTPSR